MNRLLPWITRRVDPDARLPDLLELVARSLRAGTSLGTALRTAAGEIGGGLSPSLPAALASVDRGLSLGDACRRWAADRPTVGRTMFAAIVALTDELGGGAAHTFDALAYNLRARAAARGEARVLTAQARASAVVIGVLPIVMAVLVLLASPSAAGIIVANPVCRLSFGLGIVFEVIGWCWTRRLTRWTR